MYKVIKGFNDKYTGEKYKVGDVVEFSTTRANEILTVDKLIEKIVEETIETPKKNKKSKKIKEGE